MESQGRGRENEDQLQSTSVQDQAISSDSAEVTGDSLAAELGDLVVVHFPGFVTKGFADCEEWKAEGEKIGFKSIRLRRNASQSSEMVSLVGAKAVFFVRSHTGAPQRQELSFYDEGQPLPGKLWLRIVFNDGERMECLVENSRSFILSDGFFAQPADSESNNQIIYIHKPQVADIQVLGLR